MNTLTEQRFEEILDDRLAKQTEKLEAYVDSAFQTQQVYLEARFEEIKEELDLPARIRSIEKRLETLEAR